MTRISMQNSISLAGVGVDAPSVAGWEAENMLTDVPLRWRASTLSPTITITLPSSAGETGVVGLVGAYLSPSAVITVRCFTTVGATSPAHSVVAPSLSGLLVPKSHRWNIPVWVPKGVYRKITITIADASPPNGAIEVDQLVVSSYIELSMPPDGDGIKVAVVDTSLLTRLESGRVRCDEGVVYKTLSFSIQKLSPAERDLFWFVFNALGKRSPVFCSLIPGSGDSRLEQMYCIFGRISTATELTYKYVGVHATDIVIEEH